MAARRRSHLFIELEEWHEGEKWQETGRWNHAMEEEKILGANEEKQAWSRPHLPTVSFHALMQLRTTLSIANVMLDLPGTSFMEVVEQILSRLIASGTLQAANAPRVREALTRLTPSSPNKLAASGSPTRSPAKLPPAVELPPELPPGVIGETHSRTRVILPPSASRDGGLPSAPPLSPMLESATPRTPTLKPVKSPTSAPTSPARPIQDALAEQENDESREWYSMLAPDADEEALDLLIAHVAFVSEPVLAFVRCAQPVDAGCESHVPVRYIFLLISPEGQETRSTQMAHALAGVMLDEPFVAAVADCTDTETFFAVLDRHLSSIAILPHVHAPHVHGPDSPTAPSALHTPFGTTGSINRSVTASSESAHSSASEAGEQSEDDEDDVILGNLEDHLRSTKGMRKVDHRAVDRQYSFKGSSNGASPAPQRRGLPRRPSFKDITESSVVARRGLGGGASPAPGEMAVNVGQLSITEGAGLEGLGAQPSDALSLPPTAAQTGMVFEPVHRRMFIELEQCIEGEWVETHHWNWAFEQETDGRGGGWSAPHLPTISARALVDLYEGLSPSNVLLEVEGTSFADLARPLAKAFVQSRQLASYREADARAVLTSRSVSKIRTVDSVGSAGGALDLSPEANEEAFDLIIAHTDVVNAPAMAFARLATPIQLGCEKAAPVRFVFALLAPPTHTDHSVQIATAFAAIMLDMDFAAALRVATDAEIILNMLKREMECITIVPHSRFGGGSEPARATEHGYGAAAAAGIAGALASNVVTSSTKTMQGRAAAPRLTSLEDVKLAQALAPVTRSCAADSNGIVPDPTAAAHPAALAATRRRSTTMGLLARKFMSKYQGAGDGSGVKKEAFGERRSLLTSLRAWVSWMQRLSLPLILGIVVAVAWANLDPMSYNFFVGADYHVPHWGPLGDHTYLVGHKVTLHFLVNDLFMVFFFGIAAKEVTEACLPGGSLNPIRKALSPLVGTIGGVLGPIAIYVLVSYIQYAAGAYDGYESSEAIAIAEDACTAAAGGVDIGRAVDCDSSGNHRRLGGGGGDGSSSGSFEYGALGFAEIAHGWGVPTATDISLAWMVAMQVFPQRHPGIEFLLLLAVADDAIGLIIIAIQYKDPLHPTEPIYLLYVLLGMLLLACLRTLPHRCRNWWPLYILFGGVPCWFGLISARLHPALALVFVVPFLPATVLPSANCSRPAVRGSRHPTPVVRTLAAETAVVTAEQPASHHCHDQHAALHAFEHSLKLWVDLGMFLFTLCNAGVRLEYAGPLTLAVFLALLAGKLIGILGLVLLADRTGCAPLNARIRPPDLAMVASTASIGLTVALFIAGEAYEQERLKGEAKLGALLSGLIGVVCAAFARTPCWSQRWKTKGAQIVNANKTPTPDVSVHFRAPPSNIGRLRSSHYDYDDVADIVAATLERSLLLSQHHSKHGGTIMQPVLEDQPAVEHWPEAD